MSLEELNVSKSGTQIRLVNKDCYYRVFEFKEFTITIQFLHCVSIRKGNYYFVCEYTLQLPGKDPMNYKCRYDSYNKTLPLAHGEEYTDPRDKIFIKEIGEYVDSIKLNAGILEFINNFKISTMGISVELYKA